MNLKIIIIISIYYIVVTRIRLYIIKLIIPCAKERTEVRKTHKKMRRSPEESTHEYKHTET